MNNKFRFVLKIERLLESWIREPPSGFIVRREPFIGNQCVFAMTKNTPGKLIQKFSLSSIILHIYRQFLTIIFKVDHTNQVLMN